VRRVRRPRQRLDLKSSRTDRADPALDLSRILFVHIKEMRHRRSHRLDARIIEFHVNLAMKDLQQGAIPILHDVVMRGKALVDELPQVISDRLASVPVGNTEVTNCILCEAIEPLAEGLVVDFFSHRQQPRRRGGFRECDCVHSILVDGDVGVGSSRRMP
jgi:hypothetical protein